MLNLVEFMEAPTEGKDKLAMMGTIKPFKYQDLVSSDSKVDSKIKKKYKKPPEQKRDKSKSQEDPSCSKKNFHKKNNK